MKKFLIGLLALVVVSIAVYASSYQEAKSRAYASAVLLSAGGYKLKGMKGEYLNQSEFKTYSVYLYSGNQYAILGAGDNSVRDLDVQIYNKDWTLIASDNSNSNVSIVKFYPPRTGRYLIRTQMYSGNGYFFQMVGWR